MPGRNTFTATSRLHPIPVEQGGEVHLGNGCTSHRRALSKDRRYRIRLVSERHARWAGWPHRGRKVRPVLQQCQFVGDVRRQQVAARVDSTWPNFTKIGPNCSSASRKRWPRGVQIAPDGQDARERAQPGLLSCPAPGHPADIETPPTEWCSRAKSASCRRPVRAGHRRRNHAAGGHARAHKLPQGLRCAAGHLGHLVRRCVTTSSGPDLLPHPSGHGLPAS